MIRTQCFYVFFLFSLLHSQDGLAKYSVQKKEVVFWNGTIRFSGSLYTPRFGGPHPAVVVAHGSGSNTRKNWFHHVKHFPAMGVALLVFDKRGSGKSQGNWMTASFREIATDVLSGVRFLRKQPNINPKQVGIWGGSQGWYIGLTAASLDKHLAFLMVISGIAKTYWEQEEYRVLEILRKRRTTREEWSFVKTFFKETTIFFKTGKRFLQVQKLFQKKAFKHLFPLLLKGGRLPPKSHPMVTYWRKNIRSYPLKTIPKVACPTLSMWGEKDHLVDVPFSLRAIRKVLKRTNKKNFTLHVFKDADHGLQLRKKKGSGWGSRYVFVPRFKTIMNAWLKKQVTIRAKKSE